MTTPMYFTTIEAGRRVIYAAISRSADWYKCLRLYDGSISDDYQDGRWLQNMERLPLANVTDQKFVQVVNEAFYREQQIRRMRA